MSKQYAGFGFLTVHRLLTHLDEGDFSRALVDAKILVYRLEQHTDGKADWTESGETGNVGSGKSSG
jgi:hypothetical protein